MLPVSFYFWNNSGNQPILIIICMQHPDETSRRRTIKLFITRSTVAHYPGNCQKVTFDNIHQ